MEMEVWGLRVGLGLRVGSGELQEEEEEEEGEEGTSSGVQTGLRGARVGA